RQEPINLPECLWLKHTQSQGEHTNSRQVVPGLGFGPATLVLPGGTDNSWGPQSTGDHGAPVFLPKLKKAYEKGIGASHGAPY
ncbi:unnamed protein product, partial [Staurois parvus]